MFTIHIRRTISLVGLICGMGIAGCDCSESEVGASQEVSKDERTHEISEVTLESESSLKKIIGQLEEFGAVRVDNTYHLPWAAADGSQHGYHKYYNLPDGTCLQLQIRKEEAGDTVVGFAMGPVGKSYSGKVDWFSDRKNGLITRSSAIKLSNEQTVTTNSTLK